MYSILILSVRRMVKRVIFVLCVFYPNRKCNRKDTSDEGVTGQLIEGKDSLPYKFFNMLE